ncbi:MAG: 30S ribosomal protein S16, partial [SAR324 cluster bacterium]|nr:30S ribosomal protein S16 [SAR324 cluster bacterium]
MTTRIRLARGGRKKNPYYRIVVADKRAPRDGKFVERIGHYNPLLQENKTSVDPERAQYWLGTGAQPSDAVRKILEIHGFKFDAKGKLEAVDFVAEAPPLPERPKKESKKSIAKRAAAEQAAQQPPPTEAAVPAEEAPAEEAAAPKEAAPAEEAPAEEAAAKEEAAPAEEAPGEEAAAKEEAAPAEEAP